MIDDYMVLSLYSDMSSTYTKNDVKGCLIDYDPKPFNTKLHITNMFKTYLPLLDPLTLNEVKDLSFEDQAYFINAFEVIGEIFEEGFRDARREGTTLLKIRGSLPERVLSPNLSIWTKVNHLSSVIVNHYQTHNKDYFYHYGVTKAYWMAKAPMAAFK
jgi:hypothetical protein